MRVILSNGEGLLDGQQTMISDKNEAIRLAKLHDGKIYIADGKYTKELDGIEILDYLDKEDSDSNSTV